MPALRPTDRLSPLGPARVACALAVALLTAACGSGGSSTPAATAPPLAASGSKLDLRNVCPSTIAVQMDGLPRAAHGGLYRLLGLGPTVDAGQKRVSGELVASGRDTGVRLEVRSGGASIGVPQVSAQLYADTSITLGVVPTDEAVQSSKEHPVLQVMAPMDLNPQVLLWSPQKHADWNTIADVGRSNATVLYAGGATSIEYLVGAGVLRRSQVDGSYDGTPNRFVGSGGTVAQQGDATDEPYLYSHELPAWNRPIRFQLVQEAGYPAYPAAYAIRTADRSRLAPCLQRLVPVLQQATADYVRGPKPTNQAIVEMVRDLDAGQGYTIARAGYAIDEMKKLHVVGNGSNRTIGDFDMARIQRLIEIVGPIFARAGRPVAGGLRPQEIATNEFIDPNVGL